MSPSLKWNQRQKGIDGRKRKEKNNKNEKRKKECACVCELLYPKANKKREGKNGSKVKWKRKVQK